MSQVDLETSWEELNVDEWWDAFVAERKEDLDDLFDKMKKIKDDGIWSKNTIFKQDPLDFETSENNWKETNPEAGPLRSNQEENWSQWLAHLIRSSSGEFRKELFGEKFNGSPIKVKCEKHLHHEEEHDRRVDIIVEFEDKAISIEVKKGDTHYEKTTDTVELTGKEYKKVGIEEAKWCHYLLLPEDKRVNLDSVRFVDSKAGEEPQIKEGWKGIELITWREVSKSLRRALISGNETSLHWQASAFLFISLIEQKICKFYSFNILNEYSGEAAIGLSELNFLRTIDPQEQIDFFDDFLTNPSEAGGKNNETK